MASTYPDLPNNRLAWDRDGSILLEYDTDDGSINEFDAAARQRANNESEDTSGSTRERFDNGYFIILFPAPVSITHYFIAILSDTIYELTASTNTTNGVDGDWFEVVANVAKVTDTHPGWRDDIKAVESPANGIIGIRYRTNDMGDSRPRAFHLYGSYDTSPHLMVWDPSLDQRIDPNWLNWGDVVRGSTETASFRVKNTSSVDTAEGVNISDEALTDDGTNPYVGQHDYSQDGGTTWADPLDIGNLGPGDISGEIQIRRDIVADAALGIWALRVTAEATSWS